MTIYFIIYFIFLILGIICIRSNHNTTVNKAIAYACFVILFIVLALRHETMGIDLQSGYIKLFDMAVGNSFRTYMDAASSIHYEWSFKAFVWVIASIVPSHQFFLGLVAFISLSPIAFLFSEKSEKPVMSWIIYMGMSTFLILFSTLRQSITVGIGVLMYLAAERNKYILFCFLLVLATLFHTSAIILILIYPAVKIKESMKIRIIALCALIVSVFFTDQLGTIIEKLIPMYAKYVEDKFVAYRLFFVLILIYILCCFLTDNSDLQSSYMNLFFLTCCWQLTGLISQEIPREGFYFMPSLCVLLPSIINSQKNKKISITLEILVIICFTAFGLYSIYITEWTMSYPYYWFWQTI